MKSTTERIHKLRLELRSLSHDDSQYNDLALESYIQFQKSISAAAKAVVATQAWRQGHPITIQDVAQFYRAPANRRDPPGCIFCLEDMKGGVARDSQGRPILCMLGVIYGSEDELKQQVAYALQRAAHYRLPHQRPDEVCIVAEAWSRESGGTFQPTFRVPDAPVRSLFDFMKTYFPGSQFSTVHFCGLPSFVVGCFKMVKPFMSAEIFSRLKLKANFAHLKKDGHVTPDNLLPVWEKKEGSFDFDLDRYVEWRAEQEGISLDKVTSPGQGRDYRGLFGMQSYQSYVVTTHDLLANGRQEKVILQGWLEKRGSGIGMFASNRWKRKYVVLTQGMLLYFESSKVSETNAASRVILLDKTLRLGRSSDYGCDSMSDSEDDYSANDQEHQSLLYVEVSNREYIFACTSEKEADQWLYALQQQQLALAEEEGDKETHNVDAMLASSAAPVNPLSVSSLLVGDYHFSKEDEHSQRLRTTLRQQ